MNKLTTGVVAVALLTAATAGPAWGWGNINATNNMNKYDQRVDNRRDSRQDNRQDNRDFSDRRVTNTTDSRDMSNHQSWSDSRDQSDRRDMSDHSQRTKIDSHNVSNNQQYGDKSGGALFKEKVNIKAGHETVNFGAVSGGTGNVMDASVNGNTFVIGSGSN